MDYAALVFINIIYIIASLALVSAGLAVVFGMMRVVNLAHGEFVMLGGYTTYFCVSKGVDIYLAMLVVAPLVVGAIGLIAERAIVQFLYGRLIDTMLATWGLSLVLVGAVTMIFGASTVGVPVPIPAYELGESKLAMSGYNLFVIVVAVAMIVALWLVLRYTRVGLIARGAMQSAEVLASLGYNPSIVYMLTFTVGAALSGLAGGVLAPLIPLEPATTGGIFVAKAFITVITGGASVIAGTVSAATLFGTVNQALSFGFNPVVGELGIFALAIVLLRLMPQGITGRFFRGST
jgi:urea transport system permease protein